MPKMSVMRMTSFRFSFETFPAATSKLHAFNHSSEVISASMRNSCNLRTKIG